MTGGECIELDGEGRMIGTHLGDAFYAGLPIQYTCSWWVGFLPFAGWGFPIVPTAI